MPAAFPSQNTVIVPDLEATGKMVVDFSRNPSKFPLNRYAQIVPVDKTIGLYLEMTIEEAGRILNTDLSELVWPDGNDAPMGEDGTESHQFRQYSCKRYAPSAKLGDITIEQAAWDIVTRHAGIKAQQMMTARTQLAATALQTSGNYASSHTSAVASITGNSGAWNLSTTARQDIKRSLNSAADIILKDTLTGVSISDLILVMNPTCARKIAECQEIVDHVKGSPEAWAQVRGELPGMNAYYGLPDKLYGFQVVVEDTTKVTSRKGETRAASYVFSETSPALISRPGGLVGVADAPSFSTLTIFQFQKYEMAVEKVREEIHKRMTIRVVDMNDIKLTAPVSGFLFTSATS